MPSDNWIDNVLSEIEHVETPRSWLWFSLVSAISAVAANYHTLILKGAVVVKPNVHTILLGESGLGKEFPITLALELVSKAKVTRVIAGRSSIQGIIKDLSESRTSPDRPPIMDARAFIVNGELSTAIINDPDALTLMTDLYDRKIQWENRLKGSGVETLKNTYVTALFGSSYSHFYDSIPAVNIKGGYIGRNFIVEETKLYQQTDLFSTEDNDKSESDALEALAQKYSTHLEKISTGSGRIVLSDDAKEYFNSWRRKWREENPPGTDETGFKARVPIHVLKVGMCLVLSDYESSLVMEKRHVEEAISRVSTLSYNSKRVAEGHGIDPLAKQTKMVVDFLISAEGNTLSRKQLLIKGYGNYSSDSLDEILSNLLEIGWISRERTFAGRNSDWIIHLDGEPLRRYLEFMERARRQNRKRVEEV